MRLNKLFYILLTCILTLGLAACSDDDNDGTGGGGNSADYKYLPNKIEAYSEDEKKFYTVEEIEYDDQGRILKIENHYDDESQYITFKYDSEGKITSQETIDEDQTYTVYYTYSDKKVEMKYRRLGQDYGSGNDELVEQNYHETLTLDDNDRLINYKATRDDKVLADRTYIYNDTDLTVTEKEANSLYYTVNKYEKTKGLRSDINMPQWFLAMIGYYYPEYNEIEEIEYREASALEKNIYTYKFQKMNNGKEYPTEITIEEIDLREINPEEKENSIDNYKISYKELKK